MALGLDELEGHLAEGGNDALGELGADAAHHTGVAVFLGRRRRVLEEVGPELQPMRPVGDPDVNGRMNSRLQDGETALRVGKVTRSTDPTSVSLCCVFGASANPLKLLCAVGTVSEVSSVEPATEN